MAERRVRPAAWRKPMELISWEDFTRVELRVGQVVSATVFAEARKPAYILHVDFGPGIGIRKSSSRLTELYRPDDLVGRVMRGRVQLDVVRNHSGLLTRRLGANQYTALPGRGTAPR